MANTNRPNVGVTGANGTMGATIEVRAKMHKTRVILGTPRALKAGMIMNTPPIREATKPMVTSSAVDISFQLLMLLIDSKLWTPKAMACSSIHEPMSKITKNTALILGTNTKVISLIWVTA
jgi:hypothetical protein